MKKYFLCDMAKMWTGKSTISVHETMEAALEAKKNVTDKITIIIEFEEEAPEK